MEKNIFEVDNNRKEIINKIIITNKQIVKNSDKLANIITTQNKVYEIKVPITGKVLNLIIYENKIIK